MLHAQIAQRAFNTALLVEPAKAMAFVAGLGPRVAGRHLRLTGLDIAPDDITRATLPARAGILTNGLAEQVQRNGQAPYALVDGVAVIEISGVLVHRGAWIGQSSGQTSYEGIAAQFAAAASDPLVRGIALEIDSFGGEVAGVFDLADAIRAARTAVPVWAFVAEHAFSAGYVLASQADRIILPRTGAVGSIGVVVMHADLSGQLSDVGVTVTLIHSGAHSPEFFDKLISHPKTEDAYKFYSATGGQPLREDVRRAFPFAGILFEEYTGSATLSTGTAERFLPAGEGVAFPIGTFDTFTTYGGPANLLEAANTIGLPLYARQHLDEKGRWIDLMTEASILPVNKRPRLAIRLFTSN